MSDEKKIIKQLNARIQELEFQLGIQDPKQKSVYIETRQHIPCVVDVETTGFDFRKDNLIQVCILPLKADLKVNEDIQPFYTLMKPNRPISKSNKAMAVHSITIADLEASGMDLDDAVEAFDDWCERDLGLTGRIKIAPIAQNYQFDKGFLEEWLGVLNYSYRFHYHYRDTMNVAMYLNDLADCAGIDPPFSSVSLNRLCKVLGVDNPKAHDALSDCHAEAEVYQKLLTQFRLQL